MAKNIMIQGTMSNAGKSLLAAGLCRIFKQDGYRVAPFKSQNMALNSFITKTGAEMGRAQVVQAEAAGIEPDVRMNPILLKPTTDVGSQVIVNGQVQGNMRAMEYYRRKREFIPAVMEAYNSLAQEYDILVIEGAGSPAEINLKATDIVNMGLAELVDAPVLLVGDIDRGGVFAQLYGTIALLEPQEQQRIKGTIVNKFRGDRAILQPGIDILEKICGVPVAGVIPYTHVDIDDEDSLSTRFHTGDGRKDIDIAVVKLPRISNFTDVSPLERFESVSVRYIERPDQLHQCPCARPRCGSGWSAAVRAGSRHLPAGCPGLHCIRHLRRLSDAGRIRSGPPGGGSRRCDGNQGHGTAAHGHRFPGGESTAADQRRIRGDSRCAPQPERHEVHRL